MAKMEPGESKIITISSGSWERPRPFSITLPSEWVKQYTKMEKRRVRLTWKESCLEIAPVEDN